MSLRKKPVSPDEALCKMQSLCARSEHSEFEIDKKLYQLGITFPVRKEILTALKEERYVDNQRFARSFTNDKARLGGWGPKKIRIALIQHRIPSDLISEMLSNIDHEVWISSALKIAENKSRNIDITGEDGWAQRKKLFLYLISRGFTSEQANMAVKTLKSRRLNENEGMA